MTKLVKNELFKIFANKKMYIFIGIITAICLLPCIVMKLNHIEIVNGQSYPFSILTGASFLDVFLPIFLIILSITMFTDEYGKGTLKLSLVRPINRRQLLTAKAITMIISTLILLLVTLVLSYVAGTVVLGWGDNFNGTEDILSTGEGVRLTLASYAISVFPLIAFAMLMVLVSLFFDTGSAAIGTGIGMLFALAIVAGVSKTIRPFMINYYFKWAMLLTPPVDARTVALGSAVILTYGVGGFLASMYYLKRKDILL